MALIQNFFGSTGDVVGSSNFNSKAILSIEEGYNLGSTIEYVIKGDMTVDYAQSNGQNQQRITLGTYSKEASMKDHSNNLSLNFPSYYRLYDPFDSTTEFLSRYSFSSPGVSYDNSTSNVKMVFGSAGTSRYRELILEERADLDNLRVLVKMQRNSTTRATGTFLTVFRYINTNNYLRVRYEGGQVRYEVVDRGNIQTLASKSGVSVTANRDYYMMTMMYDHRLIHAGSTDGVNYTKHIDYSGLTEYTGTYTNRKAKVGVAGIGSSGGFFTIKELQVTNMGNQQSFETAQYRALSSGNQFEVDIQKELDGFGSFSASSGASWLSGSSGSITRVSSTVPNTGWDTFMTTGSTLNDFIFEVDMNGSSGTIAGLLFGATNNFYITFQNLDSGAGEGVEQVIGGSRFSRSHFGAHLNLLDNITYNMKLVKKDIKASWFVNGVEQNIIAGTSLLDRFANNVNVGVAVYNHFGGSVTFSNARISYLDTPIDDFRIENNENFLDISDRYLPEGFERLSSSNRTKVIQRGSSQGTYNVGSNFYNPDLQTSYQEIPDLVIMRGNQYGSFYGSSNPVSKSWFANTKTVFINDQNVLSSSQAQELAKKAMDSLNINLNQMTINMDALPTLEKHDRVLIIDDNLGVSRLYTVDGFTTSYEASNGRFVSSLNLSAQ